MLSTSVLRWLPILPVALALAGCGPSDPKALTDQGAAALASEDARKAEASFEEALAVLKPSDPDFARASMGRVRALARIEPARAKTEFLAYAQGNRGHVTETDYGLVVGELLRKNATIEAIEVMDAGVKAFPESAEMHRIQKQVVEQAKQNPAASSKLKGLGYIGGDK